MSTIERVGEVDPLNTIFIVGNQADSPTWGPVARNLQDRGFETIIYEADKVADGSIAMEMCVDEGGLRFSYQGQTVGMEDIGAAWFRRVGVVADGKNMSVQLGLGAERGHLHYTLWEAIPESRWLNPPMRMEYAEHKLTQLVLAQELGFAIPRTVATNNWEAIHTELPENIIFKPARSFYFDDDKLRMSYTTRQTNSPLSLPTHANPFPGIWQPYLNKAREWRVTIVGDDAFDAAIYTNDEAKDDWRRLQSTDAVTFKAEDFPDDQKEKCFRYLSKMGLVFGAFDFTESHEGEITFLECNPNGQFGWLEEQLGLPISSAIADQLARIALNGKALKETGATV